MYWQNRLYLSFSLQFNGTTFCQLYHSLTEFITKPAKIGPKMVDFAIFENFDDYIFTELT